MTTLVCGIDGCEESFDERTRGYQRLGLHRKLVHGLGKGSVSEQRPRRVDDDGNDVTPDAPIDRASAKVAPAASAAPAETVPKRPSRWRERFKLGRKTETASSPATRERAPKRTFKGKRVPLDTDITDVWSFLGRRLETSPHYPTGRMLQYQAPGAGVIVDRAVAGTALDNYVLQPIARNRAKYEDVVFLLAGPLITFSITRTLQEMDVASREADMEAFDLLKRRLDVQTEGFDWLLNAMLPRLAEGKKLAEEKEEKRKAVIKEAFPELVGTEGDPAEALRNKLFAPPTLGGSHEGTRHAAQNGDRPDIVADRGDAPSGARFAAEG